MVRLARVVAVGHPHHVIQRGNRAQKVFFGRFDKEKYLEILSLQSKLFGLEVWAYCLMDNHVHLIVMPQHEYSLRQAIGETHKLYTRLINLRENWRGYLWQGRFKSVPMDDKYLYSAVRYVERNPARAGIVNRSEEYEWSSARAHVYGIKGTLLTHFYLLDEIKDWSFYINSSEKEEEIRKIRMQSKTGRPLGTEEFLVRLEEKQKEY